MSNKWVLPTILTLGLAAAISITPLSALADRALQIVVNGNSMDNKLQPKTIDEKTYVSLRPIADALGATVTWDADTNTIGIDAPEIYSLTRQVELLQKLVVATSAKQAVQNYAEGVKSRNGALQFSQLTPDLKEQKKSTFEEMNWVTGVSSPWIEKYTIDEGKQISDSQWKFTISYVYNTSLNEPSIEEEQMTILKLKDTWYVSKVE